MTLEESIEYCLRVAEDLEDDNWISEAEKMRDIAGYLYKLLPDEEKKNEAV